MPRRLRAAVGGLLAAALAATPGVAHAERWAGGDPNGDVQGWYWDPEPEPCGTTSDVDGSAVTNHDITRLVVRHTRHDVVVTVRFSELDPDLEQSALLHLATPGAGWLLWVDRFATSDGHRVHASLTAAPAPPDPEDLDECGRWAVLLPTARCRVEREFDFVASALRTRVPRECLKNPRWVRSGADASGWFGWDAPDGGGGGYYDQWGEGDDLWGPMGPRVAAAPGAVTRSRADVTTTGPTRRLEVGRLGPRLIRQP